LLFAWIIENKRSLVAAGWYQQSNPMMSSIPYKTMFSSEPSSRGEYGIKDIEFEGLFPGLLTER
jgi:hypothetical protein